MRRLLRFTMWILFFLALFVLITFFFLLPREISVEQKIALESKPKIIFSQINDLYNWDKWSTWHREDPGIRIDYVKNGIGKFAGFRWDSTNKKIGEGSLMITESVKYDSIVISMAFFEQGEAMHVFRIAETDEGSKLNWLFDYDLSRYPHLWWKGFRIKKNMEHFISEGLTNLKTVCEVQAQENFMVVELEQLDSFLYAGLRQTVSFAEVSEKMSEMFGLLTELIQSNEIQTQKSPFAIYHSVIGEKIDLECGIPVLGFTENDEMKTSSYAAKTCAVVDYYGDYNRLEQGHNTIQKWIEKRRFNIGGPPVEMYVTGPGTEPDSTKWLTKIYYPVY